MIDRIRGYLFPTMIVAGLAIVATSQAKWGASREAAQIRVNGLGGVSAESASAEDVSALFAGHTHRPGLVTLAMGVVIVVAAVLAWWAPIRRIRPAVLALHIVAAAVSVCVVIWTAIVLTDPSTRLLDAEVVAAVDLSGPLLHPGWGLIATLVLGLVAASAAVLGVVASWGAHQYPSGSTAGD